MAKSAATVWMWILTVILLICTVSMSVIFFTAGLRGRDTHVNKWALFKQDPSDEKKVTTVSMSRTYAMTVSIMAIVSLVALIIVGATSSQKTEAFKRLMF